MVLSYLLNVHKLSHVVIIFVEHHARKINQALKLIRIIHRYIYKQGFYFQPSFYGLQSFFDLGSHSIEFVDETKSWNFKFIGLHPYSFALSFDALHAIENADGPVTDPESSLDLGCKIDMARCVNQIDLVPLPVESCCGSSDCDTSLPLLFHVVHHRIPMVNFSRAL